MADLNKLARDSAMLGGTAAPTSGPSSPYNDGLQRQFFAGGTRDYAAHYGKLASNVYKGMCQGLDRENFYDFKPVLLRPAGAAKSATGETMPDDWQRVHILKPRWVSELPPGAYLTFGNNTWIVYKGTNIASVQGDGILRRCNSVINTLDWYGNLVSVPMSYAKMGTLGNASHASENSIVAKNYISCVCQRNDVSADFKENTRIILGKTAYSMRGLNDFTREFTEDAESVHLLTFTIERSEPLPQDSLEKQCADYFSFRWQISIQAAGSMRAGESQEITVFSNRNGVTVTDSEEHPVSYLYASSDETVLTVDETGLVTVVGPGTATITVTLEQNPDISESVEIEAEEAPEGSFAAFTSTEIPMLREFESMTVTAAWYENGAETAEELTFSFSGPNARAYSSEKTGPNAYTVTCYAAAQTPLVITATGPEGEGAVRTVRLMAG